MALIKEKWRPPEEGWLKINSDGAVHRGGDKGGAGAVIRDHGGAFRAGLCHVYQGIVEPEALEILACKRGLEVAREINATRVQVELDSLGVVQRLQNPHKDRANAGAWIQEIKDLLASFTEFKVSWTRRSANVVAHKLARVGVGEDLCKVWVQDTPDYVLDVLSDEIPNAFD